jgi:hypothetical protein
MRGFLWFVAGMMLATAMNTETAENAGRNVGVWLRSVFIEPSR